MLKLNELVDNIKGAFPKSLPPDPHSISLHDGDDGDELRESFAGVRWWLAPDSLIDENFAKLPFFSDVAYRYYLPAYLLRAVSKYSSNDNVLEFLLYSWSPITRASAARIERLKRSLTSEQKATVRQLIELVLHDSEMEILHSDAKSALKAWSALPVRNRTRRKQS